MKWWCTLLRLNLAKQTSGIMRRKWLTKLAPERFRTSDTVIRSPARYHWTTVPAFHHLHKAINVLMSDLINRCSFCDMTPYECSKRMSRSLAASVVSLAHFGKSLLHPPRGEISQFIEPHNVDKWNNMIWVVILTRGSECWWGVYNCIAIKRGG